MVVLFSLTLLVSSALLFAVQPLAARLLLPFFGGTPGVWNTCMVFFQTGLLAGYAYAHWVPAWLGVRRQALVHLGLMLLPLLLLPPRFPPDVEPDDSPLFQLLELLILYLGLPYLMVASAGPLLQRWFAHSGHARAADPYFLYAASNFGSMAGLLAYPFLIEPWLTLHQQAMGWSWGYSLLILLTASCAVVGCRLSAIGFRPSAIGHQPSAIGQLSDSRLPTADSRRPTVRWLLLALVPASLMLSVTQYLTTDIAAMPLLWVLPISLYLLTFILVFSSRSLIPHALVVRWLPIVVIILVLALLTEGTEPIGLLLVLNLSGLFWVCLMCHGELARTRPAAEYLTGFYLCLALGGALGGMFTALLAPALFNSLAEYPLMLLAACFLWPGFGSAIGHRLSAIGQKPEARGKKPTADSRQATTDGRRPIADSRRPMADRRQPTAERRWPIAEALAPLAVGLLTLGLVALVPLLQLEPGPSSVAVMFAGPALLCFLLTGRPLRFALGMAAWFLASQFYPGVYGRTEYRLRSFFGVHRVTLDPTGSYRLLVHGTTEHGKQSLDPRRQDEPLHYYTRQGPIGQVLESLHGDALLQRVALVGLGTGALACYSTPGQHWTFFEIDPAVVAIARDSGLFTYLRNKPQVDIQLGDARQSLQRQSGRFGVIVIDAFGSDAIPIHLLTLQALQLYLERLEADGLLVVHISNRYLDLQPVLADLARRVEPSLTVLACDDLVVSPLAREQGKAASQWVLLARPHVDLTRITASLTWRPLPPPPGFRTWTDDYANLLAVFRW